MKKVVIVLLINWLSSCIVTERQNCEMNLEHKGIDRPEEILAMGSFVLGRNINSSSPQEIADFTNFLVMQLYISITEWDKCSKKSKYSPAPVFCPGNC